MPTWPRAAHAAGHPDQRHPGHAVLARDAAELRDALESNLEVLEDLKTMVNDMLFWRAPTAANARRPVRDLAGRRGPARGRYYDAALEERGIRLRCEGDAAVAANPGLVRRALANLISNAIKATPPATRSCCAASRRRRRAWSAQPGASIAPTDLPRIFDRRRPRPAQRGPRPGPGHRPRHRPHARRRRGRPLQRRRNRDRHHAARSDRQTSRHAPSRRRTTARQ